MKRFIEKCGFTTIKNIQDFMQTKTDTLATKILQQQRLNDSV